MPSDEPSSGPRPQMGFLVAGSEMASFTLLGLLGDYLAGTLPVFTVLLTLLGVGMAFFQLVQMSRALAKKNKQDKTGNGLNDTKRDGS